MAQKRFYIDLDSIFDTRMSLLHRLDPDWVKREFNIETYRNRLNDRFASPTTPFTQAEYDAAWAARDLEILQNSLVTGMVKTLHETIASIDWGIDPTDTRRDVYVTINCWPYKDLGENSKREICRCVAGLCPIEIDVKTCYVPPELLFLPEAAHNYDLMFHYNPFSWLRLHEKALDEQDMVSLWIVAPALLWGEEDPTATNPLLKAFDPFALTEVFVSSKFTLRYIPVSDVCLLRPLERK